MPNGFEHDDVRLTRLETQMDMVIEDIGELKDNHKWQMRVAVTSLVLIVATLLGIALGIPVA